MFLEALVSELKELSTEFNKKWRRAVQIARDEISVRDTKFGGKVSKSEALISSRGEEEQTNVFQRHDSSVALQPFVSGVPRKKGRLFEESNYSERVKPFSIDAHGVGESIAVGIRNGPDGLKDKPYLRTSTDTEGNKAVSSGPVSKEDLGRATWTFLHALASQFPEKPTWQQKADAKNLMLLLTRIYPCSMCAKHFTDVIRNNPPRVDSGPEFNQWMCKIHNIVNRSLNKPQFPCSDVAHRWGTLACEGDGCVMKGKER